MTTTWNLGETLESPFAPIDSVRLPFAHEDPPLATPGRIRFRTRRVAAAEVIVGTAFVSLYAIAREKYGSDAWTDLITAANPGVKFTRMKLGTKLRVPAAVVAEEAVGLSDLVGGSPVTMGDPLTVPFGQFTFNAEGNDIPGNPYYSRIAHWPKGKSGVTVGRGFDLGQHTPEQVVSALTRAGVPSAYIPKLAGFATVKGTDAEKLMTTFNSEHKTFELTREQQWTLFVWEYLAQANDVARGVARWEMTRPPATAMDIASLDVTTIELLIDLKFRGDLDQRAWELLRPAVNNRPALGALMQTKSNWSGVPAERYRARCEFLGVSADKEVGWELEFEPSFEQPAPGSQITAAVGQGQTNSPNDVRRVQARLRNLGMSWVPDSGTIGAAHNDPTDHGIRLFRAMLEAEQLWVKKARNSPCHETPVGKNRGTIQPGSTEETWLWSMGAPRWLSTVPAQRDGWCCNDKSAETGCRADIAEPATSSWLAEYLDQVGRAFRGEVQAFRPVLTVLASQGLSGLERLRSPSLPRMGPLSPAEEEAKRIAAIAQRVAIDLVNPASASRLDSARIAGETVAAIDGGRIVLTVSYIAVPQGGCSTNHLGHQQGLEFDLRLFAHDGPKPGVSWQDMRCSRLLMGLAVDCFVENPLTRVIIYNDPAIRERVGGRLSFDKAQGTTHDNHVHVGIAGSAGHRLIPAPLPAGPSRMGPTLEQPLAPSEEDFAGESPEGCCSTCARQRQEAFESPFAPADPVRLPLAHEGPWQAAGEVGSTDLWVPGAKRIANPRSGGGSYLDAPWRFVFHTIEGEPTAADFQRLAAEHTNTPHLWAMPSADLLLQTVPLNRSAYALARPGSVQTNRLRAIQVEMWGFAAKMGQMDQRTIEWLADRLLGPVAKLVPINLDHVRPAGGVSCYGRNSGCRMTPEQWQVFDGVCGHQHVPDNDHWDPGDAPLRAIAARARGSAGSYVPQREQLADHDGPGFAAERDEDEDEFESWTGGFEQLTPPDAATPPPPGFAPRPPEPPLAKPIPITRDCCLLDVKSLKDTTTMGHYTTPGGPASGVPGTVYTARAGFVDLGHLLTFADVTAFVYQQIYAKKGAAGTTITTAYGTAKLTAAVADNLWLEQARKIAYDDSIAYEIETTKGASSFLPGHLNSAFSPEDLCSNYLGTVVTAKALYSPTTKAGYTLSWANRVDVVLLELLQVLGVQGVVEAGKAFVLKNNVWIAWTNEASGLSPYYLKRRNFTCRPWLAGHPNDQPGWAPTDFAPTPLYTYTHRSGFTREHFEREINTFRAWAHATFGPDYDKP